MTNELPAKRSIGFRNILAFLISLSSFFFLVPGVYLSMLSISSSGSIAAEVPHVEYSGFFGIPEVTGTETRHIKVNIFDTSRSILKTVQNLWNQKYRFVSALILLFSVIIPVLKGLTLIFAVFSTNKVVHKYIFTFVKSISKWSMCDVFITAIFLSYLSTGAGSTRTGSSISVMGYDLDVDVLVGMHAHLQTGFWCFLTYCLLSLIALQLYKPY